MLDSENAVVIANILIVNEPLVVPVPVRRLTVFDTNGENEWALSHGAFVLGVRVKYGINIPKDLGLNSQIASRNALGNLRKLLWSLEGIFETSEDTRLSNPDT